MKREFPGLRSLKKRVLIEDTSFKKCIRPVYILKLKQEYPALLFFEKENKSNFIKTDF